MFHTNQVFARTPQERRGHADPTRGSRAAFMKTMDYLMEDPEKNVAKIMDMLD